VVCVIKKIDHIGIVVKNIDETLKVFSNAFGFEVTHSVIDTRGEFRSTVISINDANLELIQPLDAIGSVARFLEQKGGGMHHVSFEVENIDQLLQSLERKGLSLLNKVPQSFESGRVAFVHPHSTAGVLVELVEKNRST
jgi:methylmalonyl-CoA/ethylmalonyl-CoA epimerase